MFSKYRCISLNRYISQEIRIPTGEYRYDFCGAMNRSILRYIDVTSHQFNKKLFASYHLIFIFFGILLIWANKDFNKKFIVLRVTQVYFAAGSFAKRILYAWKMKSSTFIFFSKRCASVECSTHNVSITVELIFFSIATSWFSRIHLSAYYNGEPSVPSQQKSELPVIWQKRSSGAPLLQTSFFSSSET